MWPHILTYGPQVNVIAIYGAIFSPLIIKQSYMTKDNSYASHFFNVDIYVAHHFYVKIFDAQT